MTWALVALLAIAPAWADDGPAIRVDRVVVGLGIALAVSEWRRHGAEVRAAAASAREAKMGRRLALIEQAAARLRAEVRDAFPRPGILPGVASAGKALDEAIDATDPSAG